MYATQTEEYAEGRAHGENAFYQFGGSVADSMVDMLILLDRHSLYALAFRKSVARCALDSLA